MAPSKKKKKAPANPARGFATVSLPSKASVARQDHDLDESQDAKIEGGEDDRSEAIISQDERIDQSANPGTDSDIQKMTPGELEEHLKDNEIQAALDQHGPKSKSGASRQAARLETERRMLRLQASKANTNSWLTEQAIAEILQAPRVFPNSHTPPSTPLAVMNETDLVVRLWTLQQVLTKLRLPAIDQALTHVLETSFISQITQGKEDIWGLSESLDWYGLHADEHDLPNYDYTAPKVRREILSDDPSNNKCVTNENLNFDSTQDDGVGFKTAGLPRKLDSLEASSQFVKSPGKAQPNISQHQLHHQESSAALREVTSPENAGTDSLPRSSSNSEPESLTESDDDINPAKLVSTYIKIRSGLFLSENSSNKPPMSQSRRRKLEDRAKRIERDVLFDQDAAGATWNDLQKELFANLANQRKSNNVIASTSALSESKRQGPTEITAREIEEDEDEMGLGDIFGAQNELTEESQTSADTSMQIVDFGNWTGVQPRRVLEELCKQRDTHCQISINLLSSSSFAFRHGLRITWSSEQAEDLFVENALPLTVSHNLQPQRVELKMQTIATPSKTQSEAYISTLALFVVSSQDPKGQNMSLRLAQTWRDLWTELIENRKKVIVDFDKATLRKIQSTVIEARSAQSEKLTSKLNRSSNQRPQLHDIPARPRQTTTFNASESKSEWTKRSSTPSFQTMLTTRTALPISTRKALILETVAANPITIISAETGAGKSTQVPSYILEHALSSGRDARIIVTQPRRISAITLARRVSAELGERAGSLGTRESLVGYAIRLESKTSAMTRITFATTGVLLRMLEGSPDFGEVDCVVLDEVHERTMDLDLLFIAVRRAIANRPSLKLVLMSATIDSDRLSKYFGGAPVLDVAGRTYPVEVGFLEDAVEACIDSLPTTRSPTQSNYNTEDEGASTDMAEDSKRNQLGNLESYSARTRRYIADSDPYHINYTLITAMIAHITTHPHYAAYSRAILIFLPGISEIRRLHSTLLSSLGPSQQPHFQIHLLHSSFSTTSLEAAFLPTPPGVHKIVLATNIAETGITIPDITAVIDTAKEKTQRYDERRHLSRLVESFISRSSARQRRGRAARVQAGLCFHLVTKHRFETLLPERHVPEMLRLSLAEPILRVKMWDLGIGGIEETLLSAMEPPTARNVRRAVEGLKEVGALTSNESLTALGRQLARLPLDVELGKLCLLGVVFRCLDSAVTIAAILSSKSPFQSSSTHHHKGSNSNINSNSNKATPPDLLTTHTLYQAWKRTKSPSPHNPISSTSFCTKNSLNELTLFQIEETRLSLLTSLADAHLIALDTIEHAALNRARQRNSSSDFFSVPDRYNAYGGSEDATTSIIAAAFYPKLLARDGKGWRNVATNQTVRIADALSPPTTNTTTTSSSPRYLSYHHLTQSKSSYLLAHGVCAVPESAVCILLGQSAEVRAWAGVLRLDGGRVQVAVREWRSLAAIRRLRGEVGGLIGNFLREPLRERGGDGEWVGRVWGGIFGGASGG